jgi:hypothetical protein
MILSKRHSILGKEPEQIRFRHTAMTATWDTKTFQPSLIDPFRNSPPAHAAYLLDLPRRKQDNFFVVSLFALFALAQFPFDPGTMPLESFRILWLLDVHTKTRPTQKKDLRATKGLERFHKDSPESDC